MSSVVDMRIVALMDKDRVAGVVIPGATGVEGKVEF